jgi:hypothetical protein
MATPKKKATAKKTTKATTARKKAASKHVEPRYTSFKRADNPKPFVTFQFTQQTVYWLILSIIVLALGVWVITLSVKVQNIYNKFEADEHAAVMNMHADHNE